MHLNDLKVRGLPFEESGQRDYPDDAVRGLAVRVGKRTKTFMLVTGTGSGRKRHTLGQYDPPHLTLAMAREKARDIIAANRLSKNEAPRTTFSEALETFYRTHIPEIRPRTAQLMRSSIDRHFVPKLGQRLLADVKVTDIAPLVDAILETPSEMRNAFVYLRTFLNWCAKRGYIESVPTARMEPPRRRESRSRVLTTDELISVWHSVPETDYGTIVKLCILSGQRIGQWAAVRREYISDDSVTWPAQLMKAAKAHTLPLTPNTRGLLPQRRGFLFPTKNFLPFSAWSGNKRRLDKASGTGDWTHHDLRRTFATMLAEMGILPHIIERILAHQSGIVSGVAAIYNRASYMVEMKSALLAFENKLQGLLSTTENADGGRNIRDIRSA